MPLYLCVDCGGSKTAVAISDASGKIVGRGTGGPSNLIYLTAVGFITAVTGAISDALQQAIAEPFSSLPPDTPTSLPITNQPSPFAAAWFGISGVDSPAAIAGITPPISELLGIPAGPNLIVVNDTHLLAAPVRMYSDVSYALAVVAGTGSIAVGFKEEDGKLEEIGRIGGWGWILGDEGGGYDVGRETIRQILIEHDKASIMGTPLVHSKFIDRVLEKFGAASIMEIFVPVYRSDPSSSAVVAPGEEKAIHNLPREKRISSLPPLVFAAAFEDADPLALRILKATAGHLAWYIGTILGDGLPPSARYVKAGEGVISFGGSLVGIEAYRNLILEELSKMGHVFRRVAFVDDAAAAGATGLAATYQVSTPS